MKKAVLVAVLCGCGNLTGPALTQRTVDAPPGKGSIQIILCPLEGCTTIGWTVEHPDTTDTSR